MKIKYNPAILMLLISITLIISITGCSGQPVSSIPSQTVPPSAASTTRSPTTTPLSGKEISVFAGSASKPALDEAADAFEKQTGS